jgi:hypothetical protein
MAADSQVGQAPPHFDLYDPFIPMYDWAQPNYRPPEPWFTDVGVQPPMPERIAGRQHDAAPPHVSDATLRLIEITQAVTSMKGDPANEVLLDQNLWRRYPTVKEHPWFADGQVPQEMVNAAFAQAMPEQVELHLPEATIEQVDPLLAMDGPDPRQVQEDLEALVQDAMLQQNFNQPQPDLFAEQQMMYEEEMKQLLDPFALPGFGPG